MSKWVIHVEKTRRSWWDGKAVTLCGARISEVKVSGYGLTVTCPKCARLEGK